MKLHTNPQTGKVMSMNLDSPQMPNFLQVSHRQVYQFVQKARSNTHRRYLTSQSSEHLDIFNHSLLDAKEDLSLPNLKPKQRLKSFGHSSEEVKVLMNDRLPEINKMTKGCYHNKIFGTKKVFDVPEDRSIIVAKDKRVIDYGNRLFPRFSEVSKLALDLSARVLVRSNDVMSPKCLVHSTKIRSSKRKNIKINKIRRGQSLAPFEMQKSDSSKIRSTLDDYQELYLKQQELDPHKYQNTMNRVLAFESILNKLKSSSSFQV